MNFKKYPRCCDKGFYGGLGSSVMLLLLSACGGAGGGVGTIGGTINNTVNLAPKFSDLPFTKEIFEGDSKVGTYAASAGTALTYHITGDDKDEFKISDEGVLSFVTFPDYDNPRDKDGDNTYNITIVASDGTEIAEHGLAVSVTNVNDNVPKFSNLLPTKEIPEGDSEVGTYTASDADGDTLNYSLKGDDGDKFGISNVGVLSFATSPDYENPRDEDRDNIYNITIVASDGTKIAEHGLVVSVTNVNDNVPKFSNLLSTKEIPEGDSEVGTYTASDADGGILAYSLKGDDGDKFRISNVGVLSFATSPDYENPRDEDRDNIYNITIVASDGTEIAEHKLEVSVIDVDERDASPMFAPSLSNTTKVAESGGDSKVGTYAASAGTALTYHITGDDKDEFKISDEGVLSFVTFPDYDNPRDKDGDNTYNITIVASDGTETTEHKLDILVENVDEAPVFETTLGSSKTVIKGQDELVLETFTAKDPENGVVIYSVSDNVKFAINETTGELSLKSSNIDVATYSLTVTASDKNSNATDFNLSVRVKESLQATLPLVIKNDFLPKGATSKEITLEFSYLVVGDESKAGTTTRNIILDSTITGVDPNINDSSNPEELPDATADEYLVLYEIEGTRLYKDSTPRVSTQNLDADGDLILSIKVAGSLPNTTFTVKVGGSTVATGTIDASFDDATQSDFADASNASDDDLLVGLGYEDGGFHDFA